MKKVISLLLAGAVSLSMIVPAFATEETDSIKVYVSLEKGNDENPGLTYSKPVQTPEKAQAIARAQKAEGKKVEVIFDEGEYLLDETLSFTAADSGTEGAPVVYRAYQGADVKFSLAKKLTADMFSDSDNDGIYEADLTNVEGLTLSGDMSEVVYQNGAMQTIATGKITTSDYEYDDAEGYYTLAAGSEALAAQSGMKLNKKNSDGYSWSISSFSIYTNSDGAIVESDGETWITDESSLPTGTILNSFYHLDEEGEYYIDAAANTLYYMPVEDISDAPVYISSSKTPVISLNGADYVSFEGIDLFCGAGNGYSIESSDNVVIYDADVRGFANCGIYALGATNLQVIASTITDMQRGAVLVASSKRYVSASSFYYGTSAEDQDIPEEQLYLIDSGNTFRNCRISNVGKIYKTSAAAVELNDIGVTVANCEISDGPYIAIRFTGNNHLIENNKIHDFMSDVWDSGMIYSMRSWVGRGTVIRNNFFYQTNGKFDSYADITSGLWYNSGTENVAVYVDDLQSGITVDNNVIYNMSQAFMIGGGIDNTITNNTVIESRRGMKYDNRGTSSHSEHIEAYKRYSGKTIREFAEFVKEYNSNSEIKAIWDAAYPTMEELVERYTEQAYTELEVTLPNETEATTMTVEELAEWTYDNTTSTDEAVLAKVSEFKTLLAPYYAGFGEVHNRTISGNVYTSVWGDWSLGVYTPSDTTNWTQVDGVWKILRSDGKYYGPLTQFTISAAADDSLTASTESANKLVARAEANYSVDNYEITMDGEILTSAMGIDLSEEEYVPSFSPDEDGLNKGNSFTAVAAIYDGNGVLKALQTEKEMYIYDNQSVEIEIDFPEGATNDWQVKVMLWDSISGLKPIASVGNPFAN